MSELPSKETAERLCQEHEATGELTLMSREPDAVYEMAREYLRALERVAELEARVDDLEYYRLTSQEYRDECG